MLKRKKHTVLKERRQKGILSEKIFPVVKACSKLAQDGGDCLETTLRCLLVLARSRESEAGGPVVLIQISSTGLHHVSNRINSKNAGKISPQMKSVSIKNRSISNS